MLYIPDRSAEAQTRVDALLRISEACEIAHRKRAKSWTLTSQYLQGLRQSDGTPISQLGIPSKARTDRKGRKRVRVEKALQQYQTEVGRLIGMDLNPVVRRRPGVSLDTLRKESTAQAFLSDVAMDLTCSGIPGSRAVHLAAFGTVGYGVFAGDDPQSPWRPTIELIPVWELRAFPAEAPGTTLLQGYERRRWVPYEPLKKIYKGHLKFPARKDDKRLRLQEVKAGVEVTTETSPSQITTTGTSTILLFEVPAGSGTADVPSDPEEGNVTYVEMREFFFKNQRGQMTRHMVLLGDYLSADNDYQSPFWQERLAGRLPIMPIWHETYLEVASYYGRSFVDRLISVNRELEFIVGDLLNNVRKANWMRRIVMPGAGGINKRALTANHNYPIVEFNPDTRAPTLKPEILDPGDTGGSAGPLVNMFAQMMMDLGAQGPMFQGDMPSRADSLAALQGVLEAQAVPMASTAESMLRCWTGVWRAVLDRIKNYFTESLYAEGQAPATTEVLLRVARIDEGILGLSFDPGSGQLRIDPEFIPDPMALDISLRAKYPRTPTVILEGLETKLNQGRISATHFDIEEIREGLDQPAPNRRAWNNYESAWMENLLIVNDGQTPAIDPAEFTVNSNAEDHGIHAWVHDQVISSPLFKQFSVTVQRALITHQVEYHRPNLAGWPEDLATMDQMGGTPASAGPMGQAAGLVSPQQIPQGSEVASAIG